MNPIAKKIVDRLVNKRDVDNRRTMPAINEKKIKKTLKANFGPDYADWVEDLIVVNNGVARFRSTMPAICESDFDNTKKQFIWRWLAFILSTRPNHHYVPNNHGEMLLIDDEYMQAGVTADSYIPVEPYLCQPEQMEAFKGCDHNANLFAMMDHLFDVIDTVLQVHFKLSDMMNAKTMRQTAIQKKLNEYI